MRVVQRQHAPHCRRGWYAAVRAPNGEDAVEWRPGDAPPGAQQWHTADCETEPMIRAYSLEWASPYRFVDQEWDEAASAWVPCKRVDQAPRYAREMVALLFGGRG